MKTLFLDVDGVLNRCGASGHGLESDKIALLKEIVDATGCGIVLSSMWRKSPDAVGRLDAVLTAAQILWDREMTPVLDRQIGQLWVTDTRGREIQHWLNRNPVQAFVILDDDADMGALLPHLVKTDSFTGLTPEIAAEVIRRFNEPTNSQIYA
jgi:hypothetical protein